MTFISQTAPLQQVSWNEPFAHLGAEMRRIIKEAVDRHRMKATLRNLSAKDLRDIGLIRNDLSSVDYLPLTSCGAFELSKTARARAGNW